MIKREIYASGKSKCSINNQIVTLAQLQEIGDFVGDIHSQNDSIGLINPKNYLSFLNNKKTDDLFVEYNDSLKDYKDKLKKYNDLFKKKDEDTQKSDFLKYQLKELNYILLNTL